MLVLALPLSCYMTLDKSLFLSRPHLTFPYLSREDYRTKHCSPVSSVKAAAMKLTELGPGNCPEAQEGFEWEQCRLH